MTLRGSAPGESSCRGRRAPVALGIACVRIAVGVGLAAAPRRATGAPVADAASGPMVLMTRTVGIRDLVIGIGTASAARARDTSDTKRWLAIGLLSDLLDVATGAASARSIGKRRAMVSALIPVPVIAADLWALWMLDAHAD
jgi:hypothetical protein